MEKIIAIHNKQPSEKKKKKKKSKKGTEKSTNVQMNRAILYVYQTVDVVVVVQLVGWLLFVWW